jgi:hypothetical protein
MSDEDSGASVRRGAGVGYSPDFTPLDFWQRFTGRFSADGDTISGTWETGDGSSWKKDFDLTYARIKR